MNTLREAIAEITPAEQELAGLPSSVMRILPITQDRRDEEPPIQAHRFEWVREDLPERLSRTFTFDDYRHLALFVREILDYQAVTNHHGTLTVGVTDVRVEVRTHGQPLNFEQGLRIGEPQDPAPYLCYRGD